MESTSKDVSLNQSQNLAEFSMLGRSCSHPNTDTIVSVVGVSPSIIEEVIYLTNACGDETGYGTLELSDSDFAKVEFEQGPGYVIPYIVQIGGIKYVLGNLEVAFNDEFWGESARDFDSEPTVRAYCQSLCEDIRPRMTNGAKLLDIDENDPGRLIIGVAIPLDTLKDRDDTSLALKDAYGRFSDLPPLSVDAAK